MIRINQNFKKLFYTNAVQSLQPARNKFQEFTQRYFFTQQEQAVPQQVTETPTETAYEQAKRYADSDTNFERVYTVLPKLSDPEKFAFAKMEIQKINGRCESCEFVRYKLNKYDFKETNYISEILSALDGKSGGQASATIRK
jgi:hypothetical protein